MEILLRSGEIGNWFGVGQTNLGYEALSPCCSSRVNLMENTGDNYLMLKCRMCGSVFPVVSKRHHGFLLSQSLDWVFMDCLVLTEWLSLFLGLDAKEIEIWM